MAQQLELFDEMLPTSRNAVFDDDWPRHMREIAEKVEAELLLIRRRKPGGILVASEYAHLTLYEAARRLAGFVVVPAQVNAWVHALLMAQVRPPQREAIGLNPKQRLKRRSGRAREPPPCRLCRPGSVSHVG